MMAVAGAWARAFWRDPGGLTLTLVLPPLVYLLFAAIFGAGAGGEIDARLAVHDAVRSAASAAVVRDLGDDADRPVIVADDLPALERAVVDGRADAGVLIDEVDGRLRLTVVATAGGDVAAQALIARLEPVAAVLSGDPQAPARRVARRDVGPRGDVQAAYYAGAVSVMFVFFAAMHGAMAGLDERRSGLQARMALAGRGLAAILSGRALWLVVVAVLQSAAVFAVAWMRLPPIVPWQAAAALATAVCVGVAAAGLALALVAASRSREQAQPLTTFVALLLAALGGSMAPRFLMPEAFRALGWATPHAWAIEAYQSVVWRGELGEAALAAWGVLLSVGLGGFVLAWALERRRAMH